MATPGLVRTAHPHKSILELAGIAMGTPSRGGLSKEQMVDAVEQAVGEAYLAKLQRMVDAGRGDPRS